jgi:Holliday junction resolvase RusA-like endonuclease
MQNAPDSPWEGPLSLRLAFYFPRPTSHFGTGKNADRLKASAPKHHTKRPDADNLAKLVKDAMNGVFYLDDAQVVRLRVKKEYSRTPRTFVMLRRLK